jgi:hypothetical protein
VIAVLLLAVTGAAGCGDDDDGPGSPPAERADRPAEPPPGWRTVVDERAGFSISVPPRWRAQTSAEGTLVRSPDRLVAVSVQADRGAAARSTPPDRYALDAIASLPGYRDLRAQETRDVPRSPYPNARIDGIGVRETGGSIQRVTVAVFQRPESVTYAAIAFRDAQRTGRTEARRIDRVLASLRARPPRG